MALRQASYDVAAFASSMAALDALEAQRVEILITGVEFPEDQPNGVALGLMARLKRAGVKVLFVGRMESVEYTEGVGELLVAPVTGADVVERVGEMLVTQG